MPTEQLKPRDKVVLKMTKDGAVEENLTTGKVDRVSARLEEVSLKKLEEEEALDPLPPEVKAKRRQPSPNGEKKDAAQATQTEEPQKGTDEQIPYQPEEAKTEQDEPETLTGNELPTEETPEAPKPSPNVNDRPTHSNKSSARVLTDTAVSNSVRKTQTVRSVKTDSVVEKAEKVATEKPKVDEAVPKTEKIERLEKKSEAVHAKLEKARDKLPTKKVLKAERTFDEEKGKAKTRLCFEDEVKKPKGQSKLRFEAEKTVRNVGDSLASTVHGKIHEVEQDNSAVEAAHRSEIVAESAVRHYSYHKKSSANKPFEKVSKLEHEAQNADTKLHYEKTVAESPEMKKSKDMNKHYQKQSIKKEYAAARKSGKQTAAKATSKTGSTVKEKAGDKVKEFVSKHKGVFIGIGVGMMLLILLSAGISSCTAMFSSSGTSVIASSYLSEDEDMLGAEAQYSQMEADLKESLDNYERDHPGYDEYHFELDGISHDPYVLTSILSAMNEGCYTLEGVQELMQTLFDKQYILTETEVVEVRYRTETREASYPVTDPETGQTHLEYYTYEVEVPYNYYIMNVKLENFDLSHLPVYIMTEEELELYAGYMETLGNREDLFPDSEYVSLYIANPPTAYAIDVAFQTDEKFTILIEEA